MRGAHQHRSRLLLACWEPSACWTQALSSPQAGSQLAQFMLLLQAHLQESLANPSSSAG